MPNLTKSESHLIWGEKNVLFFSEILQNTLATLLPSYLTNFRGIGQLQRSYDNRLINRGLETLPTHDFDKFAVELWIKTCHFEYNDSINEFHNNMGTPSGLLQSSVKL